jgi:tetratricopeptide (TPR) repeat protein
MITSPIAGKDEKLSSVGAAADFPADLRAAIIKNPLDPRVWFNYGAIAYNAGDSQKAFEGFRRAVLTGPGFAPAQAQVMVATAKRAGSAVALAMGWRLACVVPTSAQNWALITLYLYELKNDQRVSVMGRMSLVLDPGSAGLYRLMALSVSRSSKEMAIAAGLLKRALALQPSWVDARLALAGAWFALNDFEAAERELRQHECEGTGEGAMLYGRVLLALERLEEADAYFEIAARLEPGRRPNINIVRQTMDRSLFKDG